MTTPPLPEWWPPSGYEELTEGQVRELFAYLRTIVPPVMADARRRIQDFRLVRKRVPEPATPQANRVIWREPDRTFTAREIMNPSYKSTRPAKG